MAKKRRRPPGPGLQSGKAKRDRDETVQQGNKELMPAQVVDQSEPTSSSTLQPVSAGNIPAPIPHIEYGSVAFPPPLSYELRSLDLEETRPQTDNLEMEQTWSSSGYYGYFGNDSATRAMDRGGAASISPNEDESQHRRPNQYLPPPPPHSSSPHNMNLPPFQQTFYPASYHSPPGSHGSNGPVNQGPGGMHHVSGGGPPHPGGPYNNHNMMPPPPGNVPYAYPVVSPAMSAPPLPGSGMPRQAPPHSYSESPRMAGGYSSSPGFHNHHLSPTSPTNHLIPPGFHASSGSTSSSSYQSARAGVNILMRDNKRRSGSDEGQSNESWDDDKDEKGLPGSQPWGMPQEEYKALNPRDKKQVRNRIGARRFRAKRKDYVSNLEHTLKERDEECSALRGQLESHRTEINDLRHRLGLPSIPAPPPSAPSLDSGGLGLLVTEEE